jgi:hypothetical protein
MKNIKTVINKITNELCWEEVDWITEIGEHQLLYDKNIFKLVDNFGYDKFESMIIAKIEAIRKDYELNFINKGLLNAKN